MDVPLIPLILLAMVAALRLLGRRWWCSCGRLTPWTSAVTSSCNSQHGADPYSLTHVQHGLFLYLLAWLVGVPAAERLAAVVAAEGLWECVENTPWVIERYRAVTLSRGYYGDSIANSVGDVLCCLAGAWYASVVAVQASIVLALAIELGLLLTIRDSLGLNVLMLVRPSEAIRRWQNS